jgi:hypothetical protein
MAQSIAVAIIHGIGRQGPDFAEAMIARLRKQFARLVGSAAAAHGLVFQPVYWAPVLQKEEDELWKRLNAAGAMGWRDLREFMVDFAADAIAYQPIPGERDIYDRVHAVCADALKTLGVMAGEKAPLCVIAHSLGTVIAGNYLYDLQTHVQRKVKELIAPKVLARMGGSPVDRGETLALLYTLGSPLALWSLRYADFGKPIDVPSPSFSQYWPGIAGEWVNYYDTADVIGYPLKKVNAAYAAAVAADRAVRVGGLLTFWNPLSHTAYMDSDKVCKPIAASLARLWRAVNP